MRKIKARSYSDGNRPQLKWVVNYREDGKRKRKFYETKEAAQNFANEKNDELISKGRQHAEFPEWLRIMAQECDQKLKAFGKTVADATEHFIAHLQAIKKSCKVAELVDEVIAAKKKACGKRQRPASDDYILDLDVRLGRFKKDFGERIVGTITPLEIEDWLSGLKDERTGGHLSPQSRGNYARVLSVAFGHAVKRRYATANPIKEIQKATSDGKPGILTVEQTAALLEGASPEILPYIAIGAFAGLRAKEIERLDWRDISFEENEIAVGSENKTGERHVDILPNLREWLLPHRKHSGKIIPDNFRKHFDQARIAAGFKDKEGHLADWPDNALRHSFASYHLKHFGNDGLTKLQMGHWRDSDVLFGHYRRAVTRRNAERYWTLRPVTTDKVVELAS
jgi:integrase